MPSEDDIRRCHEEHPSKLAALFAALPVQKAPASILEQLQQRFSIHPPAGGTLDLLRKGPSQPETP